MKKQTRTDIQATRDFLQYATRWTQRKMYGSSRRSEGQVAKQDATCACLLGAINISVGGRATPEGRDRYNDVEDTLRPLLDEKYPSLVVFNDAPETEHSHVLAFLDRALGHKPQEAPNVPA